MDVYDVLLSLADVSRDQLVRQNAMQLLETMPTDSKVVQQLTAVLDSKTPCQGMWQLLVGTGTAAKPARLLYTIQVCIISAFLIGVWSDFTCQAFLTIYRGEVLRV